MKNLWTMLFVLGSMSMFANDKNDKKEDECIKTDRAAAFYTIKSDLLQDKITIEQAQRRWIKEAHRIRQKHKDV